MLEYNKIAGSYSLEEDPQKTIKLFITFDEKTNLNLKIDDNEYKESGTFGENNLTFGLRYAIDFLPNNIILLYEPDRIDINTMMEIKYTYIKQGE